VGKFRRLRAVHHGAKSDVVAVSDHDRLIFAGLILLMLSFVHGDKVFSIIKNRKDAISLLIFSVVGALTVQLTFLLTIEKSNAATATVLQFLSPTIIVAWFSVVRKARPGF
jgi:drug/metabolite transporter (DMT)-like permease